MAERVEVEFRAKDKTIAGSKSVMSNLDKMRNRIKNVATAFGVLSAAYVAKQTVQEISEVVDKYKLLEGRLGLVARENENLADTTERLYQISQTARNETGATIDLYTRLARSTKDLDVSQEDLFNTTELINKAITISGSTAQEAGAALFQLGQGLSAGALRGEELNSVMEQTPRLAQVIADGLGVTIGKLRELGSEGKLNSETVINAIQSQGKVINEEFAKVPTTVGQSMTQLKNQIERIVKGFTGVNNVILGAITSFKNLVTSIEEFSNRARDAEEAQKKFRDLIEPNEALLREYGITLKGIDPSSLYDVNRILRAAKMNSIDLDKASKFKQYNTSITTLQGKLKGFYIAQQAMIKAGQQESDQYKLLVQRIKENKAQVDELIMAYVGLNEVKQKGQEQKDEKVDLKALEDEEKLLRQNLSSQEAAAMELTRINGLWQAGKMSVEAYTEQVRDAAQAFAETGQAASTALEDEIGSRYESLSEGLLSERELIRANYDEKLIDLTNALDFEKITWEQYLSDKAALHKQYTDQMDDVDKKSADNKVALMKTASNTLVNTAIQTNGNLFDIAKSFAKQAATAALQDAVMKTYANNGGWPWGVAPAAIMAGIGGVLINKISSLQFKAHAGITKVPYGSSPFGAELAPGERVLTSEQNEDLTRFLKNAEGGGGGVYIDNLTMNMMLPAESLRNISQVEAEQLMSDVWIPAMNVLSKQGIRMNDLTVGEQL